MHQSKKIFIKAIINVMFLLLFGLQRANAVTDDCETGYRWVGYLTNDTSGKTTAYAPIDFFTPEGAKLNAYKGDNIYEHTRYEFNDTTCTSDHWRLDVRGTASKLFYSAQELLTTLSIEPICNEDPDPSLKDFKPAPKKILSITDTIRFDKEKSRLKAAYTSTYNMTFTYKDDTLLAYTDGRLMNRWIMHICKIIGPSVFWQRLGDAGTITQVDYYDYTNGTEYHEDFSDCANTQEYHTCEPDPILVIEPEYQLPSCDDPYLRLKAKTNYTTDLHWEGPNGFTSNEQSPVINYKEAESGKYLVWGRLSACVAPEYSLFDIEIPELGVVTERELTTCHGDTIWVGNHFYTESGTYRDTTVNSMGCDSILISNITFEYLQADGDNEVTTCHGDTIWVGTHFYTESGNYRDTIKTKAGCDSIVVSKFKFEYLQADGDNEVTTCHGDTIWVGNHFYTESGNYRDTIKTKAGCDSIVVSKFKFEYLQADGDNEVTTCHGDTIWVGNHFYTESGSYRDTIKTKAGCDSIVVSKFKFEYLQADGDNEVTTCHGDTIWVGTHFYTESGNYRDTIKTKAGCDSIVVSKFKFEYLQADGDNEVTTCHGDTIWVGNHFYTESGNYRDTIKTKAGCDSIVVSKFNFEYLQADGDNEVTTCHGDTIWVGNHFYTESGNYRDTIKTKAGCDSIVVSKFNFEYLQADGDNEVTTCHGDTIWVGNHFYTESGNYRDTIKTKAGCDSIVVSKFNFEYLQADGDNEVTTCHGDTIWEGNHFYTESGSYRDTIKTKAGCDSIVVSKFKFEYLQADGDNEVTTCHGDTIWVGNHFYTESGNYRDTIKTKAGCDSIVVSKFNFEYLQADGDNEVTTCHGDTIWVSTHFYTESGNYRDTIKTKAGCDSIVVSKFNFEYLQADGDNEVTTCHGDTIWVGNHFYTESGNYRDTIKTKAGCDSIVVLRLNVLPIGLPVIDSISICLEDSSSINGFHINGTNEILDTFKTEFGCDSTVIHIVSIKPQSDTTFNYMICRGEPITVIDGNTFNTDTLYSTLMTFEGYECKVRTTINVAKVPTLNLKDTAITLCGVRNTNFELDSIEHATYRWEPTEGVSQPFDRATAISIVGDSATYKVHIDRGSCNDSLNVHFNYFNTSNLILTSGSHQDLGELETISLAVCNDKQDPIYLISPSIFDSENKYGTDRWYTYHKALHWAVYRDSISAESGIFSNTLGNTADSTSAPVLTQTGQSGSYYFVATDTTSNCSDTVGLDLQLQERPRIAISLNGANRLDICEGSTIDIDAFVHVDSMNATITEQGWLFDGKPYNTTDSIFATADSVHFLTYFATNVCGTSRSDSTYFTSQGELTFADSLLLAGSDSAYQEMKKDQLTIRQAIEVNVHRPLNASDLLLVTNPHNKANVFAGSDAELELHTPQQLATIWWYRVRDGFDAISGTHYDADGNLYDALEQNDEMLGIEDIARVNAPFKLPLHALTQTGTYYAVVSDSICPAIHSNLAEITVTELIPTAITPYKRDNLNDTFMLGYPVQIYNRYGQLVHESDNGWDGTYRGLLADPGVYYYSLTMRDGSIRKGTIEVVDLYGKSTLLNKGWVVR